MSSPVVSIVIASDGLEEAVRTQASVATQTFPSIDTLIVSYCPELVTDRACTSVSVTDPAQAWSAGAARAPGKYICFVPAGYVLAPTYVEKCAFLLECCGLDICGSWERTAYGEPPFGCGDFPGACIVRRSTLLDIGGMDTSCALDVQIRQLWEQLSERPGRAHVLDDHLVFLTAPFGLVPAGNIRDHVCPGDAADLTLKFSYEGLLSGPKPEGLTVLLAMPFLTVGGAEAITSQLCRQLKKQGFTILVATTLPVTEWQGDATSWYEDGTSGIYHLPLFLAPEMWRIFLCYLIQQHSVSVIWQVGSSFVYHLMPQLRQSFPSLAIVDLLFNPVGHTANYLKYNYLIDHVVTEHAGMKDWLVQHGESEENISVIPNGIDLDRFSPKPRLDWRTGVPRPSSDTRFVVGFIGRLAEEKAPDLFLEIAALLAADQRLEFVVFGSGPMELQLQSRIAQLGLAERVHMLGFAPSGAGHLCCDVVVVCSRLDGRPNSIMECLAMGIPVVASRVGGIPELVPDGKAGYLVEACDIDGFAQRVTQLAGDAVLYRRMCAAARVWAEENLSIAMSGARFADLFRLLRQRRAGLARSVPGVRIDTMLGLSSSPPENRRLGTGGTALRLALRFLSPAHFAGNCKNMILLWRLHRTMGPNAAGFGRYFNRHYYLEIYPDVKQSGFPPLAHYLLWGSAEGRNPSARFDTKHYLTCNPDVARSTVNPLLHYLLFGRRERRSGAEPGCPGPK
jgi:glycosyltransferase involved in cell wall biosynthesis